MPERQWLMSELDENESRGERDLLLSPVVLVQFLLPWGLTPEAASLLALLMVGVELALPNGHQGQTRGAGGSGGFVAES